MMTRLHKSGGTNLTKQARPSRSLDKAGDGTGGGYKINLVSRGGSISLRSWIIVRGQVTQQLAPSLKFHEKIKDVCLVELEWGVEIAL